MTRDNHREGLKKDAHSRTTITSGKGEAEIGSRNPFTRLIFFDFAVDEV